MIINSRVFGKSENKLIILHGFLGSLDNWITIAKKISDLGFEVHIVDQRNHGKSFHSDLISEIYGKKNANKIVVAGIFASFFSLSIIYVANSVPAIDSSPVDNETFTSVFYLSGLAVLSSMLAYLFAQFIDIKIYHYWKKKTKGRMLWLRNNFSTFTSQFIDTFTVVFLLCITNTLPWDMFTGLLISGFLFKVLVALIDTPLLYLGVYYFRKKFDLEINEEIDI